MSINETMRQPVARLPTKKLFRFMVASSWLSDTAFLMTLVVDDATSAATEVVRRCGADKSDHRHCRLLRARRGRPRRCTAEQRDELAALCMSGKQHSEGRRGFGHDRLPVATGSPQALRILNRE